MAKPKYIYEVHTATIVEKFEVVASNVADARRQVSKGNARFIAFSADTVTHCRRKQDHKGRPIRIPEGGEE